MADLRVDLEGAQSEVISVITSLIGEMREEAKSIIDTMGKLGDHWEGSAYTKAMEEFETNYKTFIAEEMPNKLDEFNAYIEKCLADLKEVDDKMAGKA